MKVLVVVPDFDPNGGTRRFLETLLQIHGNNFVQSALLIPEEQCGTVAASLAEQHGVELLKSPNRVGEKTPPILTPWFDYQFSWQSVRSWRPDLVVVSTGDPGRMTVAMYYPVPVLYILHTIPDTVFRALARWYLRIGSMLGNRVMTVSHAAATSISEFTGIPRDAIAVIHNSVEPVPAKSDAGETLVVTVGHVVAYKNPHGWLAVARRVLQERPDARFVWVGDGELLTNMREEVKASGLEGRVHFPGYTTDPSMWYGKSQVYFQPSLRESHGIAVLEAMAHGLPCVVSGTGGLPESVVDGQTGYVCHHDDAACFARRIVSLLDSPELRMRMGAAGQVRSRSEFSVEVQERKILELYGCLAKLPER